MHFKLYPKELNNKNYVDSIKQNRAQPGIIKIEKLLTTTQSFKMYCYTKKNN